MTNGRNQTMGRIIARAWSDHDFKRRLLAITNSALSELGLVLPAGKTVIAVENTAKLTHIVLTAPRFTETKSVFTDIKEFGESYRDPRFFPLNWGSHDPIFTARFKTDPKGVLRYMGIDVRNSMTLEVVENSMSQVYLVLPAIPKKLEISKVVLGKIAAGQIPSALRYAGIEGQVSYRQFY